jgi:hypothetical protein
VFKYCLYGANERGRPENAGTLDHGPPHVGGYIKSTLIEVSSI